MQETISYSATSIEALEMVEVRTDGPDAPLSLSNPMSAELTHMRTSLRASVLQTLAFNRRMSRGEGLRLFEIGSVYLPREEAKERDLPDEKEMMVGVFSGPRSGASWLVPEGDMDFFDAKGVLEAVFAQIGLSEEYKADNDPILLPGKTAQDLLRGQGGRHDWRDTSQDPRALRSRRRPRRHVRDRPGVGICRSR